MTDARTITPMGFAGGASLENHYTAVEDYLNKILEEFQMKFHSISNGQERSLEELGLTALSSFIYVTHDFKSNVSSRIEAVIRVLEQNLLSRSDRPDERGEPKQRSCPTAAVGST
jgi:hypothetical protein